MDTDWSYGPRARCWRLALAACVERWPASLEHVARIIAPGRQAIATTHVFADMQAAQDWCLREIARQAPGRRERQGGHVAVTGDGVGRRFGRDLDI
jgi:hypothetical protein